MTSPIERIRDNITSATALVVIGIGLLALGFGVPNVWLIFLIGLLVVVPLVGLLFGAEDWRKWDPLSDEFWEDLLGEGDDETVPESPSSTDSEPTTDPLETLRSRYARGELTDEQFERKLEFLLETESLEDVEDRYADRDTATER